jgi:predicted DNA-binding transcriptional regulator AlpA
MKFEFELKFKLPVDGGDRRELVEHLGEAGCNDALVGIGQPGRISLKFTRDAQSAREAIVSALEDVRRALPAAELIEAGPDFVGLTDVAEILGMTRQNMRKLMLAHRGTFPAPVHEGSAAIWHLEPLLQWVRAKGNYTVDQALMDVAHMAMQINLIKAAGRLELPIENRIRPLVA